MSPLEEHKIQIECLRRLCRFDHGPTSTARTEGLCVCGSDSISQNPCCVALDVLLQAAQTAQWCPIRRFPQTIDGLEAWDYRVPQTKEEVEAEEPLQFPGYPELGEVQHVGLEGGHRLHFAQSEPVETLGTDGFVVSARWTWRKYTLRSYRWEVFPANMNISQIEDVDFWRPLILPEFPKTPTDVAP